MENELKKGDSLRRRLSVFSQAEIAIYKSAKRTNELLRMFLEMNAAVYTIPLHHGWLYFDQSWKFVTMNGRTHTRREELLGVLDIPLERRMAFLSIIGTASEMVQRSALEKAVVMMRTFRDPWVRKKLWLYLHAAAIFSLMKIQRIKLETGLCICSDSHNTKHRFSISSSTNTKCSFHLSTTITHISNIMLLINFQEWIYDRFFFC